MFWLAQFRFNLLRGLIFIGLFFCGTLRNRGDSSYKALVDLFKFLSFSKEEKTTHTI